MAGGRLPNGARVVAATAALLIALLPCPSARGFQDPATDAPAGAAVGASPPQDVAQLTAQDLARLAQVLGNAEASQDARDDAARRLVSRRTPNARAIVADALVNLNVGGQMAAARALAEDPDPDPRLINPLFAILGTNRQLTEAACRALIAYKSHPEVTGRLINYVQRRPPQTEAARLTVIRALGAMPEKRAAEFLVNLLTSAPESAAARAAAADALAELSGRSDLSADESAWRQWWESNAGKTEEQFRADLLTRRSARHDRLERRVNSLAAALEAMLVDQYRGTPPAERPEVLLRHLRAEDPHVRAVAARLVTDEALEGRRPGAEVRQQLRQRIGDSDAVVRAAVAEAFAPINDAASFDALLAQLAQEPSPQVRALLARALAPIKDARAVPVLVGMLSDPSLDAAAAAAGALRSLAGALRESDAAQAQRVAAELLDAMERRTGPQQNVALREQIIDALGQLRQADLLPVFTRMLEERRAESVEVRRLAIRAIGEIAHPQSAGVLITALEDREPRVRLEAVQAMQGNPALAENAEALRDRLDPQREPAEDVRAAAWRALETVFPDLPKEQLQIWADRFKVEPARRQIVLKALADRQLREKDEDGLATTRQTIAQVLVELRDHRQAAEYFRLALEYKQTQPAVPPVVIEALMRERMRALLLSRDYAASVAFAAQMIEREPGNVQLFGGLIWNEAQRLRDDGEFQPALELIAAANDMNPPLSERYRDELDSIEKEIRTRQTQQNGAPTPPGPRSASAASSDPLHTTIDR